LSDTWIDFLFADREKVALDISIAASNFAERAVTPV